MGELATISRGGDPIAGHAEVIERSARVGSANLEPGELIPEAGCAAIIEAATARLGEPAAAPTDVAKLVRLLVGAYPAAKPQDPETYTDVMADILAGYPVRVGMEAVRQVVRTKIFPPAAAEIAEACANIVARTRIALLTARRHRELRDEMARRPADGGLAAPDVIASAVADWRRRMADLDAEEASANTRTRSGGHER